MKKTRENRTGRTCVFDIQTRLVFLTKRRSVFTLEQLKTLERLLSGVCADFGAELLAFDGGVGHAQLLVRHPPKVAVSVLVNSLKGVSSRMMKKEHPEMEASYWDGVLWSPSYFASSHEGILPDQYIKDQ